MTFRGILNSVKACQTTSSSATFEKDGLHSVRSFPAATNTMRRAVWFMDPWVYTLRPRGFPVENKLDELILPLTIQLLHSCTTFSGDLHTSLLQQTCIMAEYFIPDLPSNSWTFGFTFRNPGVPSCKWTRQINSASNNSATSFLDNL